MIGLPAVSTRQRIVARRIATHALAAAILCACPSVASAQFVQSGSPGHEPQIAKEYREAAQVAYAASLQRNYRAFQHYYADAAAYYDCLADQLGPHGPPTCREPPYPSDQEALASGIADGRSGAPVPSLGAATGAATAASGSSGLINVVGAGTGVRLLAGTASGLDAFAAGADAPKTVGAAVGGAMGSDIAGAGAEKAARFLGGLFGRHKESHQPAAAATAAASNQIAVEPLTVIPDAGLRVAVVAAAVPELPLSDRHGDASRVALPDKPEVPSEPHTTRVTDFGLLVDRNLTASEAALATGNVGSAKRAFDDATRARDSAGALIPTGVTTAMLSRIQHDSASLDIAIAVRNRLIADASAHKTDTMPSDVSGGHDQQVTPLTPDQEAAHIRQFAGIALLNAQPTPGLEAIGARVTSFRFFETGRPIVPLGVRVYARAFDVAEARVVLAEISLAAVQPSTQGSIPLACAATYGGTTMAQQVLSVTRSEQTSAMVYTFGMGWDATGHWEPGVYTISCHHDNQMIVADSFIVTGVTARSAFANAERLANQVKWDSAATEYALAVRLDTADALHHYRFAKALVGAKREAEAERQFAWAARLAPEVLLYHLERADLLRSLRRLDESVEEYREVARLDARNPLRHMVLADVLAELRRDAEAVAEYRAAATLNPSEPYYASRIADLTAAPKTPPAGH